MTVAIIALTAGQKYNSARHFTVQRDSMKDQIATDLGVMGAKIAPPVAVAAGTAAGAVNPQSLLVWITIAYTVAMFATFIIKNVGEWEGWWSRRWAQIKRAWAWFRRE